MTRLGILVERRTREGGAVPFGVIHQDIFDSTLARNYEARHLFQDMIILADENDNVMMDVVDIAHRTRVPLDLVERALEFLLAPDEQSKSHLDGGRRLKAIQSPSGATIGYHVVNRHYYKRLMSRVRRREYMRRYRAKKMEEARRGAV